jgi:hypothetical protein
MSDILLSDLDATKLMHLASVLIPGTPDMPAVSALEDFDGLIRTAVRGCGYPRSAIAAALTEIPVGIDWETAEAFAQREPKLFQVASTLASAAYYMARPVLDRLGFPPTRQNPADLEEFVDEYETGILDVVTERGPRYRDPGAANA